jgi:hypothetical protein
MNRDSVRCSREELYEQVWSEPMTRLAARYGLSDVGLRKKCKKLNIPLPKLGYWTKKQFGKAGLRPPLPPFKGNNVIEIVSSKDEYDSANYEHYDEAEAKIAFESLEENRIHVPSHLTSPHPLVTQTRDSLKNRKNPPLSQTILSLSDKGCLDISVSLQSLDRALRIMDALIKALEKRGFAVSVTAKRLSGYGYEIYETEVNVFDVPLGFGLKEYTTRIENKPVPDKKKGTASWLDFYPKYNFNPSGRMTLSINTYSGAGIQRTWTDGEKRKIEDCLNNFVINLIKSAVVIQAKEIERQRQEREREEHARRREERAKRIREEKSKIQSLIRESENWKLSQHIREYIEAMRSNAIKVKGAIEPGGDMEQRLTWAAKQADRLDPLVQSPPSILDEEDESGNVS